MLKIKEVVKVDNLEQAYELNQKRMNRILGGMLWMRMSNIQIQKGIDLSGLGLDEIVETEEEFRIGCMVTLRELELHEGLNREFDGFISRIVEDIVGIQFRNLATIGGSLFGRFGFSDILTGLLVMDAYVELYKGGVIPLGEFACMKKDNDILVQVILKKNHGSYAYQTYRNTKTDFPVLAVAVSHCGEAVKASVGARPMRAEAVFAKELSEEEAKRIAGTFAYGSNMRGSDSYRKHLAAVLLKRAFQEIKEKEEN